MGSGIEGIGDFVIGNRVDNVVNDVDDLLGELIEVEDGRIRVQADGMELVAILQIQRRVPS